MERAGRTGNQPVVQSARTAERPCVSCGSRSVMSIRMALGGSPVTVQVCSYCDSKTWNRDGAPVDKGDLLDAIRTTWKRR